MKAKKSYGQHFLNNDFIAQKIAEALTSETACVLEVGPGKGRLTKHLIGLGKELKVVEADKDMVSYLNEHYPSLFVIFQDFMKTDLSAVFDGRPFALIGNYPYNISSQILFKQIENRTLIPEMVGMFQKEVADRIVASPGNKDYGILSVLVQVWYRAKIVLKVDKSQFTPPPQVQSAVVRLERIEQEGIGCDEKLLQTIVKQTFNQRRKMLRNTLKQFSTHESQLQDTFFTLRPEQLSVQDFVELTNTVQRWKQFSPTV